MPAEQTQVRVEQVGIKINGSNIPIPLMDALIDIEIESILYLPSMFTIRFHDDKIEWVNDSLFAVGNAVELLMNDGTGTLSTVMKGEITAVEPDFSEDYILTLAVRGYDHGHRLNRQTRSRAYLQSKDSDIASQIAGENGLSTQVTATTKVHDHVFQHNSTDYSFLAQLAERNGFEMFVDDKKLTFRKPPGGNAALTLKWGETLRSFRPRLTATRQVDKVKVKGWNPKTKQSVLGEASSSSSAPTTGFGNWGGTAAKTAFSAAERLVVRQPVHDQGEATTMAQALLDQINSDYIQAEGVAYGVPTLKAGQMIKLEGLGTKFNGTYMVTSTRHVLTDAVYDTFFTVEGRRPRMMADLIMDATSSDDDAPWGGVVVALVTNNKDPEDRGRVKLKFPWLDDTLESNWARVASIGSGNERGIYWMPEVNDEVLVAFEHGNFNHPYVVGSLWNGIDKVPEAQVSKNGKIEVRILKTRAGHLIRFTDGPQPMIEVIDTSAGLKVKMETNPKKITVESSGDILLDAKGNIEIKAVGNIDIKATQNMTAKGMQASVEASTTLNLKASASATLDGGGALTAKGGVVKIN